ncbi:MAG: hypothetical protein EA397_00125 [Deltaproteobacteria bacterium]|nr:MAG: hypothetical protein EA397_00125 [Deltaproteobacteria bacterium]
MPFILYIAFALLTLASPLIAQAGSPEWAAPEGPAEVEVRRSPLPDPTSSRPRLGLHLSAGAGGYPSGALFLGKARLEGDLGIQLSDRSALMLTPNLGFFGNEETRYGPGGRLFGLSLGTALLFEHSPDDSFGIALGPEIRDLGSRTDGPGRVLLTGGRLQASPRPLVVRDPVTGKRRGMQTGLELSVMVGPVPRAHLAPVEVHNRMLMISAAFRIGYVEF